MISILPIPAFQDNYIWLLQREKHAVVVDPGDAEPVLAFLGQHKLELDAILITHHHNDHTGGVEELQQTYNACTTYAPQRENYTFRHIAVAEGMNINLPKLGLSFQVLDVPGHTLGHVAYYAHDILFCGDTLFSAGCGRLFEGTPAQMFSSLQKLASLPAETAVYCTHEYTLQNINFALSLEPNNAELLAYADKVAKLRSHKQPSLPSNIGTERQINPFLRCHSAQIRESARIENDNALAVFTAVRNMRNHY